MTAAIVGSAIAALVTAAPLRREVVTLVAYVSGAATYAVFAARVLLSASSEELSAHARTWDPSRSAVSATIIGSSAVIMAGAFALLKVTPANDTTREVLVGLTMLATALAWLVTNATFALHYAHLFYTEPSGEPLTARSRQDRGFYFPGDAEPVGMDFAYLAFTIGMTFQVSDVQVTNAICRRAVLGHGLIAFSYNTLLIAMVVNAVIGQLQQGA